MKPDVIRLHNGSQEESGTSYPEFARSELAKSPFGKLFVALVEDETWTSDFSVSAYFQDGQPYLIINHPSINGQRQIIIRNDGTKWSVDRVEQDICEHFERFGRDLTPGIIALQHQQEVFQKVRRKILVDKAHAKVTEDFPEAALCACSTPTLPDNFYVFYGSKEVGPIFVTRKIDEGFAGAAKLGMSLHEWYAADDSVRIYGKLGIFWTALARQCAAAKLEIPDTNLQCIQIEPVGGFPDGEHRPGKVVFRDILSPGKPNELVTVTFSDNLPEAVSEDDDPEGTFRIP